MTTAKTPKTEVEPEKTELDVLSAPQASDRVELSDGTELAIKRLKTRELLRLLRIFTHGGSHLLGNVDWTSDGFADQLVAVLIVAIPDAEDETIEFIRAMVEPMGIDHSRKLSKSAREANEALLDDLDALLDNPELEDLLEIISAIIRNEAPELQSLGKKLQAILGTVTASS